MKNDFFSTEPPPPAASRSLIMIAKCLQNLANLVEFGAKESYMEVVNPFILKCKERMVVFLDHLPVSILSKTRFKFKSFPCDFFYICNENVKILKSWRILQGSCEFTLNKILADRNLERKTNQTEKVVQFGFLEAPLVWQADGELKKLVI